MSLVSIPMIPGLLNVIMYDITPEETKKKLESYDEKIDEKKTDLDK